LQTYIEDLSNRLNASKNEIIAAQTEFREFIAETGKSLLRKGRCVGLGGKKGSSGGCSRDVIFRAM